MRTVIIDNESEVVEVLQSLIKELRLPIEVVGIANGVTSGIRLIENKHPELIFLDVEMDDGTGFDLLQKLNHRDFKVIFITAHNQYAIRAIRFSALDFLLKPINKEELASAVDRAQGNTKSSQEQVNHLVSNTVANERPQKIILKSAESIHVVPIADILWCQADGSYTRFIIKGQDEIFISRNIKEYEKLLIGHSFFRSHNSYLINLQEVLRFDKGEGGSVIMSNKSSLPVSTRKKEPLLSAIAGL